MFIKLVLLYFAISALYSFSRDLISSFLHLSTLGRERLMGVDLAASLERAQDCRSAELLRYGLGSVTVLDVNLLDCVTDQPLKEVLA